MDFPYNDLLINFSEFINNHFIAKAAITSVLVIFATFLVRFILVKKIRKKREILTKEQRRWVNRLNNASTTFVAILLFFIWAPQLQTLALSLTAVAVAIVLSTKELLMCLTGGFLTVSSKVFDVGDWITVDGVTGEVMSITAMTTTMEKIETNKKSYQFTGEIVQIPNSVFLTKNVENQMFLKDFIYYDFSITVQYADLDTASLMEKLKKICSKYYAEHEEKAIAFNKRVEKKAGVDFPDPHPQFFLKTSDLGHNIYSITFFVPTRDAQKIASHITCDFLSDVHKQKNKLKLENNDKSVNG